MVCFFTDKKTGLRLAPRDILWQRILSTKLEKQEYHSNPLATSVTLATPNGERRMAQANPTHYQDLMLLDSRKTLCECTYAASGTQHVQMVHAAQAIWGQEHCTSLLDSVGVLRRSQARLFFSDVQSQLVQIIPFSVRVSHCARALHEKSALVTDASG